MIEQRQFEHLDENTALITKEDWPKVDALIDWIIEKNQSRYKMVNSVKRCRNAYLLAPVGTWLVGPAGVSH